jgi:hypothetical protein
VIMMLIKAVMVEVNVQNTSKSNFIVTCAIQFRLSFTKYEGVSKSFRTDRLERELQMVQLTNTRCSCISIL